MKQGNENAGSGATKGMAEGDGATTRVDNGTLETEDLLVGLDDSGEGLVELPDCNLVLGDTSTLESELNGLGGRNGEVDGIHGGISRADDLGKNPRVLAELLRERLVADDKSTGTIVEGGGVGGSHGTGAITDEGRLEGGNLLKLDIVVALIDLDDLVALLAGNGDGNNFLSELAGSPSLLGALVRLDGIIVLLLTRNLELLGGVLGAVAHVELVVDVGETILDKTILHLDVAECRHAAGARNVVGHPGHVLHTTGDLGLRKTELNVLRSEDNSLETGSAHLVDGNGLDVGGKASKDEGLTRGSLADRALEDVAHVDIGDLLNRDA